MNRTSKTALAVIAAAVIAVPAWRALHGAAPVAAEPSASTSAVTVPDTLLAASEPAPAMSAPQPLKPAAVRVDDPACIVKALPPPTQGDADTDSVHPEPAVDAQAQASRARLLARMSASADPYANAVATWLDIGDADDPNHLAERVRKLAAMAASTRDPRLYSLALRTCWRRTDRECVALSARRWSEIDPGNAMPWLMMLDEAAQQHDESGLQEALFHVTHAERLVSARRRRSRRSSMPRPTTRRRWPPRARWRSRRSASRRCRSGRSPTRPAGKRPPRTRTSGNSARQWST